MRGSGGRGRALQAEEGHTSQQHSQPSAPGPAWGSLLFREVLPARAGTTGQRGPLKVGLSSVTLQPCANSCAPTQAMLETVKGRQTPLLSAAHSPGGRLLNRLEWASVQSRKASWRQDARAGS